MTDIAWTQRQMDCTVAALELEKHWLKSDNAEKFHQEVEKTAEQLGGIHEVISGLSNVLGMLAKANGRDPMVTLHRLEEQIKAIPIRE